MFNKCVLIFPNKDFYIFQFDHIENKDCRWFVSREHLAVLYLCLEEVLANWGAFLQPEEPSSKAASTHHWILHCHCSTAVIHSWIDWSAWDNPVMNNCYSATAVEWSIEWCVDTVQLQWFFHWRTQHLHWWKAAWTEWNIKTLLIRVLRCSPLLGRHSMQVLLLWEMRFVVFVYLCIYLITVFFAP